MATRLGEGKLLIQISSWSGGEYGFHQAIPDTLQELNLRD